LKPVTKTHSGEIEIPKLKPGERWNPEAQRVDAIPGSDIYIKQSSNHAKEYKAVISAADKADMAIKKINDILSPENKGGFEGNFGGYNALVTRRFPGENTDTRVKIESLKSSMKMAGLDLIRQGGSIGMMTEREWPIVEQMLAAIVPEMSEDNARGVLTELAARFNNIKNTAKNTYTTEWESTQYFKPLDKQEKKETGGANRSTPTRAEREAEARRRGLIP
jgi:hypothetical protein